jgi:PAS domain S-box-containing protein
MCSDAETIAALQAENEALKAENAHLQQQVTELRQNQTLFQEILDNLPVAIYVKDMRDERYLIVSRHGASLTHHTPAQMVGKHDDDLFGEDLVKRRRNQEHQIITTGSAIEQEELIQRNGELQVLHSITFPIYDTQGTIYAVGGISMDITEQKNALQELRTFETLVEKAPDGIFAAGLDGKVTYANPAFRTMYGYQNSEVLGVDIATFAQHDQARVDRLIELLLSHGRWQGSVTHQRKDGTTFPVQVTTFLIYDSIGNPQAIISMHHDLTEQVAQEQERTHLQQQIIEAQRAAIRELSTPLIPLSDSVVMLPLVGTIDSDRAQLVMETLLEGIAHYQVAFAILDITGVSVVDTQVAQAFLQAARAVRLLGAQVILTGISPVIAQTLVQLGADLSGIVTRSTLQAGIMYALQSETPNLS